MQLVFIGLIGAGAAAVVGLMGPLVIRAARAFQYRFGSVEGDRVARTAISARRARV